MAYDKSVPFSFIKNGIFYFERRVPADLLKYYDTKKIAYSLRTRSLRIASARARRAADQLDDHWYYLRSRDTELPGKHRLRMPNGTTFETPNTSTSGSVTLSEAVATYLRLKGSGRPITFHRAAERSSGYVIDVVGDKDISTYTRADATRFRDALIERGLAGSSITRTLGTVRSIVNFAACELGITLINPFAGIYYDRNSGVKAREPIPTDVLRSVQAKCREMDDDLRWLVALVSDTGMRLAEVVGLSRKDIVLSAEIPHVLIREHPWRRLKNHSSARTVPLVGASLWAARRIKSKPCTSPFSFPRYNHSGSSTTNAASATLNKWMKGKVPDGCTMHSFRHSIRDRLRAVECPPDIIDQIGGWQTVGIGNSYGKGYPLDVLHKRLEQVCVF